MHPFLRRKAYIQPLCLVPLLFIFTCNLPIKKQAAPVKTQAAKTLVAPQVVDLASLPDSLKPETKPARAPRQRAAGTPVTHLFTDALTHQPLPAEFQGAGFFTNYNTEDGLALSTITCGYKDRAGNLWFGSQGGGVSMYNGKSFTTITRAQGLVNNGLHCIVEDHTGNFWFATDGGVSRYDGQSFKNFTTAQGLANNTVLDVFEDKSGVLWFGTQGGGVSRYDGKTFQNYDKDSWPLGNDVRSIGQDKDGNLWFATDEGAGRYDGKKFQSFKTEQGLADDNVRSLLVDSTGGIWFGTVDGASRYNGKTFENFTHEEGLPSDYIICLTNDKAGNIWFGTRGGGVSRYNGKTFVSFTKAQGLISNNINSITEDNAGNLWFGTVGSGVSRYNGKSFVSFTTAQGLPNNVVLSIDEDKSGNIWFGTQAGGVARYDGRSFANYTEAQGLPDNVVQSIYQDKAGDMWLGTLNGGVARFNGSSFATLSGEQGLVNDDVQSIAQDKAGDMWFGTENGLARYDGHLFTTYTTAQGLADNNIQTITMDKAGNLWFGTYSGGASRYDGKAFTNYGAAQGLADNNVQSITEDAQGMIWLGTEGGISRWDGKSFLNFTTTDGLADNDVYSIVIDSKGNMICGTNLGLSMLKGFKKAGDKSDGGITAPCNNITNDELKNYVPVFEIYNQNTGYPVKDLNGGSNNGSVMCDSKGIIWAGTGDKLVRFDYSGIGNSGAAPPVFIKGIKINGEDVSWHDLKPEPVAKEDSTTVPAYITEEVDLFGRVLTDVQRDTMLGKFAGIGFDSITPFHHLPVNLILPYANNNITFDFSAVEPARFSQLRFQYMLQGYDLNWSPVTSKTSAGFGNILEGRYIFKLKVRSADGVWSEPVTYAFNVLPPWWRTWWMYIVYGVTFVVLISLIVWLNSRRLRARAKELESEITKATAEIVKQKERSEELLLNILPAEVAEELKLKGSAEARQFDEVTVMFSDFKSFTTYSERFTPRELVHELNVCFRAFDEIMRKHKIEKIKTVGDGYIAVSGLPVANANHAENMVQAAIEVRDFMVKRHRELGDKTFEVRIGLHSGKVVAGIVGITKYAYDIWGDTVNTAARMEQNAEGGKINISEATYNLIKGKFNCIHRGKLPAKNKGEIDMYFVE